MDKQRILNTSVAAAAAVNGVALLMVIIVVWLLGALLPVTYGGIVEKLAFAVAAGTLAFGLRRLVRKVLVPRIFAPGPVTPSLVRPSRRIGRFMFNSAVMPRMHPEHDQRERSRCREESCRR